VIVFFEQQSDQVFPIEGLGLCVKYTAIICCLHSLKCPSSYIVFGLYFIPYTKFMLRHSVSGIHQFTIYLDNQ